VLSPQNPAVNALKAEAVEGDSIGGEKGFVTPSPYPPFSLRGRGKKKKEGLSPLYAGYSFVTESLELESLYLTQYNTYSK